MGKSVAAVPDDFQGIVSILHLISNGGVVSMGHVNWCDIGRCVGCVAVRVPIEGVVSERGAVRRKATGGFRLDGGGRSSHCVTDDRLGIGTAGWWTAGLLSHFTL